MKQLTYILTNLTTLSLLTGITTLLLLSSCSEAGRQAADSAAHAISAEVKEKLKTHFTFTAQKLVETGGQNSIGTIIKHTSGRVPRDRTVLPQAFEVNIQEASDPLIEELFRQGAKLILTCKVSGKDAKVVSSENFHSFTSSSLDIDMTHKRSIVIYWDTGEEAGPQSLTIKAKVSTGTGYIPIETYEDVFTANVVEIPSILIVGTNKRLSYQRFEYKGEVFYLSSFYSIYSNPSFTIYQIPKTDIANELSAIRNSSGLNWRLLNSTDLNKLIALAEDMKRNTYVGGFSRPFGLGTSIDCAGDASCQSAVNNYQGLWTGSFPNRQATVISERRNKLDYYNLNNYDSIKLGLKLIAYE